MAERTFSDQNRPSPLAEPPKQRQPACNFLTIATTCPPCRGPSRPDGAFWTDTYQYRPDLAGAREDGQPEANNRFVHAFAYGGKTPIDHHEPIKHFIARRILYNFAGLAG